MLSQGLTLMRSWGRKRSKESAAFGPLSPPFVALSIARDTRHVAMDIMEVSGNLNGVI